MSTKRSRKLTKFFVGLIVLGMVVMLLPIGAILGSTTEVQVCVPLNLNSETSSDCGNCAPEGVAPEGYSCIKYDVTDAFCGGTWTAPACDVGTATIDYVWIKAGGTEVLLTGSTDCYTITGIGTSSVTVVENWTPGAAGGCQDISHICFYWKCEEDEPETGEICVTKTPNGLPGPFTYTITKDGDSGWTYPGGTLELSAANSWTGCFTDLPVDATYTITEAAGAFQFVVPSDGIRSGLPVGEPTTFENAPETGEICVTKTPNGLPGPFTYTITKDGDSGWTYPGGTLELSAANSWTGCFTDLPVDATYTITEAAGAFQFVVPSDGIRSGLPVGEPTTFENAPETGEICVTKTPNGLPGPFTYTITKDGDSGWTYPGGTLELSAANSWTGCFTDLPVDATYTITEAAGAFQFVVPSDGIRSGLPVGEPTTFENAPETGEICVTKTPNGLPGPFTYTITKDGDSGWTYPGGTLELSAANSWTGCFTDLPVDATYTITEAAGNFIMVNPANGVRSDIETGSGVTFENEPRRGCLVIEKILVGDISEVTGAFTFAVWDNPNRSGSPVATASISFTNGVPDDVPFVIICDLIIGKTYWIEETGGPASTNVTPNLVNGLLEIPLYCDGGGDGDAGPGFVGEFKLETAIDIAQPVFCVVTFINDPTDDLGRIGIKKEDAAGNKLTGAGFTLYNSDKSAVVRAEKFVDAAGKVAFINLPLGTYVVSETTLPPGVISGIEDVTVTIDEGNIDSVINVIAVNEGGGDGDGDVRVLAFTGINTGYYIAGFLLMLIGAIGSIYLTRILRRREE